MARKNLFVGFVTGVLTTLAVVIVLTGGHEAPRAMAQQGGQQAQPAQAHRYQVSAWAYPGAMATGGGSIAPSHGAYLVDSETGQMWLVREASQPRRLGRVGDEK